MNPNDDWDAHWTRLADTSEWNPHSCGAVRSWPTDSVARPLTLSWLTSAPGTASSLAVSSTPRDGNLGLSWALREARTGWPGHRIDARVSGLPWRSRDGRGVPADLIGAASHAVCSEVLEHVDNPSEVLRQGVRLLRPGGRLLVTVPGGSQSAYDRHIGHRDHFTPTMLASLAAAQSLDVVSVAGAGWPFFNAYRLAVIARGERLITDAASSKRFARGGSGPSSLLLWLMQHSRCDGTWGWQVIGEFRRPVSK